MTTKLQTHENAPWLGSLPSDWIFRRGKFFFRFRKEINSDLDCDNVLSLTMGGVIHREELGEGGLLPASYETFQVFYPNDLVFKLIDLENYKTSRVGLVPEKGIMSSAYIRLVPIDESAIYPKFAYYFYYNLYLQGIYNFLGMGVRSTLAPWNLLEIPILLPPLETQKRIAEFLDEKTEVIDELVAKKEKLIELLREKRAALITRAVTKGLDPNAKLKPSGIDWLGDIPEGWNTKPFTILFRERSVSNGSGDVQNVLSLSYGKIVDRDVETNFGLLPTSFNTYQIVEPGWIVFRLTDLQNDHKSLRTGLVTKRGIITSAYLSVEPTSEINQSYASFLLHSYDLYKVFYSMGGGVRQTIGYAELKWMPVVLPPLEVQNNLVKFLDAETGRIDKAVMLIKSQMEKLKEYRSSLIYHAVTGKIRT